MSFDAVIGDDGPFAALAGDTDKRRVVGRYVKFAEFFVVFTGDVGIVLAAGI